jgi:hypothetical protein
MAELNPARRIEYLQVGGLILICGAVIAAALSAALNRGPSSTASIDLFVFLLAPSLPAVGAIAAWVVGQRHRAAVLLVLTAVLSGLAPVWLVVIAVIEAFGVAPNGQSCLAGGDCGSKNGFNHALLLFAVSAVFAALLSAALLKGWGSRVKPTSRSGETLPESDLTYWPGSTDPDTDGIAGELELDTPHAADSLAGDLQGIRESDPSSAEKEAEIKALRESLHSGERDPREGFDSDTPGDLGVRS